MKQVEVAYARRDIENKTNKKILQYQKKKTTSINKNIIGMQKKTQKERVEVIFL